MSCDEFTLEMGERDFILAIGPALPPSMHR